MVTKEDLQKKYASFSNKELLDILENKFSYTDLAITVAIEEIAKRKLSEEDIKLYKQKKVKEINNFIEKNIVDDLTLFQKNLFFFIWIPFLNFPIKRNFIDDGFILKLKQANYYSWLGFIFLIIISIVASNLNFSTLTFIIFWIISFLLAYFFDEYFNRESQIRKLQRIFSNPKQKEENENVEDNEEDFNAEI